MVRQLVFDVQFDNDFGVGTEVDSDIYVEFWEKNATAPKETRVLGPNSTTHIFKTSDAQGVLYITNLDVTTYLRGDVTAKWYAKLTGVPLPVSPFEETKPNVFGDSLLTVDGLKSYARAMLGFPAVAVELTSEHYNEVLSEALAIYGKWIPEMRVELIDPSPDLQTFYLPDIPISGPFDVKFVRRFGTPGLFTDPFFGREFPRAMTIDFSTYVMATSFWETLNRAVSQEPEWEWYPSTRTLYVSVGLAHAFGAIGGYYVTYRYFAMPDLDSIRPEHVHWFKRYFLARCKSILAQIRSKYSGVVPSPGGKMQLRDMTEEARAETERLESEIESMAPAVPPVYG